MDKIKHLFITKTAIRILAGGISIVSTLCIGGMKKNEPQVLSKDVYSSVLKTNTEYYDEKEYCEKTK